MTKKQDKKEKSKKYKNTSKRKRTAEIYGEINLDAAKLDEFSSHLDDLVNAIADRTRFDAFALDIVKGVFNPRGNKVSKTKFTIEISADPDPNVPMSLEVRLTSVQMA